MWLVCGLVAVSLGLATALLLRLRRVFVCVSVDGDSMSPALRSADRVLVRRATLETIRADEIVVIEAPVVGRAASSEPASPLRARRWLVKRAVAVPGDVVPVELASVVAADTGALVPVGKLLVLGDNGRNSTDSRTYGYIEASSVLGVVVRRIGRPRRPEG